VDGTTVTLGVSSRLAPAPGYGLGTREVVLEGEAYFDVVNDASAPFIVRTGSTVTRVLGTTFNVRKYPQDTTVQVAVAAGKVAIGNHNATTLLNVGDVGQVDAQGKSVVVHDPKLVDAEMQWRDGWLTIDNLTLRQAAVELSRWYDLDVRIASSALADRHITISFRNELPAAVVRSIAQVLNARAEWSGRQVTFFER
jgi:ferric-dicitrate binding protein FerR (iron transport regulator)